MDQNATENTTPITQAITDPAIVPTMPSPIIPTPKKSPWPLILSLLLVATLATAGYFYWQNTQLKSQLSTQPTPTVSPISSVDPTANWQTYNSPNYDFTFKYPADYVVEEKVDGFLVITKQDENVSQAGISIETRMSGPYETYETAKKYFSESFVNSETKKSGIWEIYQGKGKDGMLEGVEFRSAITKYMKGVIEVEVLASTDYVKQFDQILSTFKFTTTDSFTLIVLKQSCIDLMGSEVAWDDNLSSCIDVSGKNIELLKFCNDNDGKYADAARAECSFDKN